MSTEHTYSWWESGVIYQIYPRSFQDSNGDGIGDLKGIQSRLPYLQDLGVTALWLNPVYPSPMVDFGYDISDYTDIHPMFGTLDQFKALLKDVHQRDMKLILDFVPNHTSDQHPWFLESRSDSENPKRDWYIWKDPQPDGSPPNNWVSYFGGSAWEWDENTAQYYLHLFTKEQPDLNWRHPDVADEMFNVLRFWMEIGVDGIRVDTISLMMKDAFFRDDTPNPDWTPDQPTMKSTRRDRSGDQPEVHDVIRQMRTLLDEYGERVLIGELSYPHDKRPARYYGEHLDECHLPFNFQLIYCPFDAQSIGELVDEYEGSLPKGAWPNWVLGNHDQDRIASEKRAGEANARLAQMLLLTLRGTPTMYYGDELGMPNAAISPEKFQDPMALNEPGIASSRDLERTPMQWDDTPYAGFSTVEPWLPVSDDSVSRNVKTQAAEPRSFFLFVKQLLSIRQSSPALYHGRYSSVPVNGSDVMAYLRTQGDVRILMVLNFADEEKQLDISSVAENGRIMLSTEMDRNGKVLLHTLKLRKHEGLMIQIF